MRERQGRRFSVFSGAVANPGTQPNAAIARSLPAVVGSCHLNGSCPLLPPAADMSAIDASPTTTRGRADSPICSRIIRIRLHHARRAESSAVGGSTGHRSLPRATQGQFPFRTSAIQRNRPVTTVEVGAARPDLALITPGSAAGPAPAIQEVPGLIT